MASGGKSQQCSLVRIAHRLASQRPVRAGIALGLVLACAACAPAAGPQPATPRSEDAPRRLHPFDALEQRLREGIAAEPDAEVGLSLVDLATGMRLGINERVEMHAASTMKVPILLELYRQAEGGGQDLDRTIRLTNEFRSIVGDTAYTLSAGADSDSTLYERLGGAATARELARLMIVRSSNLATNLLIAHVRPASINATLEQIGGEGMRVLRGVEDGPAYDRG
jgi:beta-lactamase class A